MTTSPAMKLSDKALATAKQIVANYGHDPEGLLVGAIAGAIQAASPAPSSDLVERLRKCATKLEGLETLPKPYDLYYAVKNDAPGWSYHCAHIGVSDIREAATTLTAQAARIAELEGWQPIESAPKDAHVLLDLGETIPDLVDARAGQFISEYHAAQLDETLSASGGWIIWNTASDWFVIPFSDAHGWMPLPSARRALASIRGGA